MSRLFTATVLEISEPLQSEMRGRSWHEDAACPPFSELRLVELSHHDFEGAVARGELVVSRRVADEVVHIFAALFAQGFPIQRMQRVDVFGGSDEASMSANNSSAFNFRRIQGSDVLSHHALGLAIDLNPIQNPWVRDARVDPEAGRDYLDRDRPRPGMILESGVVVEIFRAHGWYWGGHFHDMRDYHHFSKLPR